jgi:tetratricopeptide (TPR) repeat protein
MFEFFNSLTSKFSRSQDTEAGWQDFRRRSMLLGLPAAVVALLAILLLGFTQIGQTSRLESWYSGLLSSTQKEFSSQSALLATQKNLSISSGAEDESNSAESLEELEAEVELLKDKEQVYLAKLMDLDPENPDYAFQLSMAYRESSPEKHVALLNKLAPEDEPVYFRAHKFMAQSFYRQSLETNNYREKKLLLDKALVQANNCLKQQINDPVAKSIKARILFDAEQYKEAAELYNDLFDIQPDYYSWLERTNKKLGFDNTVVLQTAIDRYDELRKKNTQDDTKVWVRCWQHLVRCWSLLEDYDVAVKNLKDEYQRQKLDAVRQKFLKDQLSRIYTAWAANEEDLETAGPESRARSLDRLVLAYQNDAKNPATLKLLAWFVANDETLGPTAKEIYDPYLDPDPPADVLTELGARALLINDYEKALSLFKRARNKDSRNPVILNNLAYSHLVSQNSQKSATEALTLIEDGLRMLSRVPDPQKYASHLYHTRGTALMQLGRLEDAVASFENALRDRPDNEEIIMSLIACYEGRIDAQAAMFRNYLEEIRSQPKDSNN